MTECEGAKNTGSQGSLQTNIIIVIPGFSRAFLSLFPPSSSPLVFPLFNLKESVVWYGPRVCRYVGMCVCVHASPSGGVGQLQLLNYSSFFFALGVSIFLTTR